MRRFLACLCAAASAPRAAAVGFPWMTAPSLPKGAIVEPTEQAPDPAFVPHRWRYLVSGAYDPKAVERVYLNFSNGGNDTAEAFEAWARRTYPPRFPYLAPAVLEEKAQPLQQLFGFVQTALQRTTPLSLPAGMPPQPPAGAALQTSTLFDRVVERATSQQRTLQQMHRAHKYVGSRVLVIDPFCSHCTGEVLDAIPKAGRRLGMQMHALIHRNGIGDHGLSHGALARLQSLYDRVLLYGCLPPHRCDTSAYPNDAEAIAQELLDVSGGREQSYDAVITWNGYSVVFTDYLAVRLGAKVRELVDGGMWLVVCGRCIGRWRMGGGAWEVARERWRVRGGA